LLPYPTVHPVSHTPYSEILEADAAAVAAVAREGEPDRYLAGLLSPRPQRDGLLALAAFSAEIRRISLLVHEPAMAEIRRQWWRDALALPAGLRSGHPVADAVRAAAGAHKLPADLLAGLIDASACYPGNDAPLGDSELRDHLWGAEGALFALAARVLAVPDGAETAAGCAAAGHAYGLARLLLDLPHALAGGRIAPAASPLAQAGSTIEELRSDAARAKIKVLLGEHAARIRGSLATARHFVSGLSRSQRVGFLPLALVEPYLRALERSGDRFLVEGVRVGPLMRICRIAVAHLSGRL
jgi:phytoene synthase